MRTTVNLDPSLLEEAKQLASVRDCSLGQVIDDAIRGLLESGAQGHRQVKIPAFQPIPYGRGGLRPGVDLEDKEAMAELLGDNDLPAH